MTANGTSSTVKSAMRTLDIIELVVAHSGGIIAQDIAKTLAIPVSSLSYLLATLVERGYLHREGRLYFAGEGLDRLRRLPRERNLVEQVRPLVRALRLETDETASFFIRDGWQIVAAVTESSEHNLRYSITAGSRTPLHCIAAGKAILATMSEADLRHYFAQTQREAFTSTTVTGEEGLRAEIATIRQTGIARTDGELTRGIRGLGVAVVADGIALGAFGVAIPDSRFDAAAEARAREALLRASATLVQARSEPRQQ